MRVRFHMMAMAALVLSAACGGSGDAGTGPITGGNTGGNTGGSTGPVVTTSVVVSDNKFTPADIQVSPGQAVTWTWAQGSVTHNVTFSDGTGSGDKDAGSTFAKTFATAGTFQYRCTIHAGMDGSVLVK